LYRILPLGDQRVIIDDHRSTQLQASVLQRTVRTTVGSVGLRRRRRGVWCDLSFNELFTCIVLLFVARQHSNSDVSYWYSNCLSVRPSVTLRYFVERLNILSQFLHHTVAQSF